MCIRDRLKGAPFNKIRMTTFPKWYVFNRANPVETGEQNDAARRAWLSTKQFLKALSALTADSVTAYNAAEIDRVGAFELRHTHGSWRGSVV